jgi:hypothetical protein
MKKIIFIFSIFLSVGVLAQQKENAQKQIATANQSKKNNFTYKIIASANNTFGYDIYSDSKILIHQPSIPGMSGNNGFKQKQQAESVAKFVIDKIKKGIMPPTVSLAELKKLQAIN